MLINTKLKAGGLNIVCFHHAFKMSPYVEMNFCKFDLTYSIYYDHDILDCDLDLNCLSDLTQWPNASP